MEKANHIYSLSILALPIIILDIAILPVSSFFSLPISMFIVGYYTLLYHRKRVFDNQIAIFIFIICLITSTFLSILFKDNTTYISNIVSNASINVQKEDIKRLIYLLLSICVYRVVAVHYRQYEVQLNNIIKITLIIICLVFLIMGVIFLVDVSFFYQLKGIFFNSDVNMTSNEVLINAGYIKRYNFIFLDPNNACYFILIIIIFLYENYNLKLRTKSILWITAISALFLTQSLGGVFSLLIYIIAKNIKAVRGKISAKYIMKVFIICVLFLLFVLINKLDSNQMLNMLFQSTPVQRWNNNSMDGRIDIYLFLLNDIPPLIGNGYTLVRDGYYFYPHSDHLRILYSYGIIAYITLLIMILKRKYFSNNYLFLIPAFIAFSINSLIDEPRLLYTFIILFAIANTKNKYSKYYLKNL